MDRRKEFTLKLAYVGDTHGQIDGDHITKLGGFARMVSAFRQQVVSKKNLLKLFGGDFIGQTPYTTTFKGRADAAILKLIGFDALVPGNADFNYGTEHLAGLMKDINAPFVAANLDISKDEHLNKNILPYVLREVDGNKVAIIGLVTEEINKLGAERYGKTELKVLSESLCAAIESAKESGATHFVILSHMGYTVDCKLAKETLSTLNISPIILGNHTHTTLGYEFDIKYFGDKKGDYPTVVEYENGHRTLITNIPPHGQVLGCLSVEFSEDGLITSHSYDDVQVIGEDIEEDEDAKKIIESFLNQLSPELLKELNEELLAATVDISGLEGLPGYCKPIEDYIRQTESPIGNFAADAFCWYAKELSEDEESVDFAMIHAGGIRTDWAEGTVTGADIYRLHPFDKHFVYVVEVTGADIINALEEGVYNENFGRRSAFLIGSQALHYQYDITKNRNERVSNVTVNGEAIESQKTYRVAINGFMATGNNVDGEPSVFNQLLKKDGVKFTKFEKIDRDAIFAFLRDHKEKNNGELFKLDGALEGRIRCLSGSVLEKHAARGTHPENIYLGALNELKAKAIKARRLQPTMKVIEILDKLLTKPFSRDNEQQYRQELMRLDSCKGAVDMSELKRLFKEHGLAANKSSRELIACINDESLQNSILDLLGEMASELSSTKEIKGAF